MSVVLGSNFIFRHGDGNAVFKHSSFIDCRKIAFLKILRILHDNPALVALPSFPFHLSYLSWLQGRCFPWTKHCAGFKNQGCDQIYFSSYFSYLSWLQAAVSLRQKAPQLKPGRMWWDIFSKVLWRFLICANWLIENDCLWESSARCTTAGFCFIWVNNEPRSRPAATMWCNNFWEQTNKLTN